MSLTPSLTAPRPIPTPVPVAAEPTAQESIAATWCREIADAVAAALDSTYTDASYQLTTHEYLPAPHHLRVAFHTAGHRVDIDVWWPNPWQAPRFDLRVDGRDITVTHDPAHLPAVTLAHAAWQAILDTPQASTGETAATRSEAW